MLTRRGVREFNVIAQDLSAYGTDLPGSGSRLAELISRLSDIKGVDWLRLHYAYPADFPTDILDVMSQRPNVCNYLDIALQHISDPVLKAMRRHITRQQTIDLLDEIRARVPGIHLRTTLMTGFPGETEEQFDELMEFVAAQRFERMGAFAYCEEEGTYSALNYPDNVPSDVKQERLDRLMALQEQISQEIQNEKIGRTLRVMIDREEPDYFIGRTEWDSPEVDPEVLVDKHPSLHPGEFVSVEITAASVCIAGRIPFSLVIKPGDDYSTFFATKSDGEAALNSERGRFKPGFFATFFGDSPSEAVYIPADLEAGEIIDPSFEGSCPPMPASEMTAVDQSTDFMKY